MKKNWKYSVIVFSLFSCGENVDDVNQNNVSYMDAPFENNSPNELFFGGNPITLEFIESENGNPKTFSVQQIEQKKEDLIFRAKRIPKELYLLNKGVQQDELSEALLDLEGEQLFYFEFEENQKQDLMKKYFKEDMDAPVSYLSFDIYNDFFLVNSKGDSIAADYAIYERTYHVSPFEKIIIGFSNIDETEQLRLVYNDQLFGKGKTEFSFASDAFIKNNIKQPS